MLRLECRQETERRCACSSGSAQVGSRLHLRQMVRPPHCKLPVAACVFGFAARHEDVPTHRRHSHLPPFGLASTRKEGASSFKSGRWHWLDAPNPFPVRVCEVWWQPYTAVGTKPAAAVACVAGDANVGHQLAGGHLSSSWC